MLLKDRRTGAVVEAEADGARLYLLHGPDRVPVPLLDALDYQLVGALDAEVAELRHGRYALDAAGE